MCRRFLWCFSFVLLFCCLVLPGAASEAPADDPPAPASESPAEAGTPASEDAAVMAAMPVDDDGIDPQAGGRYYYGYIGMNADDGVIMVTQGTSSGSTVLAQLDLAQFMADQGYMTAANLTQVERYLSEISNKITLIQNDLIGYVDELSAKITATNTLLTTTNTNLSNIYSRLSTTNSTLSTISSRIQTANNYLSGSSSGPLTAIRNYLSGSSIGPLTVIRDSLASQRGWNYDPEKNEILMGGDENSFTRSLATALDERFKELDGLLLRNLSTSTLWTYDSETNTIVQEDEKTITVAELVDARANDLDRLLLKNFGKSRDFTYLTGVSNIGNSTFMTMSSGAGLLDVLSAFASSFHWQFSWSGSGFLDPYGNVSTSSYRLNFANLFNRAMRGIHFSMEKALVGSHGGSASYSKLTFDEKLDKVQSTVSYTDLLHALVGIGSDLQNPVSQLQAVLAGDDDLKLRQNVQDNVGSVTDNFTGSGSGSVSTDNISDAAGLTSGVGDAFGGNQVTTGDVFLTVSDAENYGFFSQETANALDAVGVPSVAALADDDSWLDDYAVGEDGFYSLADTSGFSIMDYLGKEG